MGPLKPRMPSTDTVSYPRDAVIGFYEYVVLIAPDGKERRVLARVDTGATKSSIDIKLAADLNLGPVVGIKTVRSSLGETKRPMILTSIRLGTHRIKARFTLSDREDMSYPVLIGQNILKHGFVIDPQKKLRRKS